MLNTDTSQAYLPTLSISFDQVSVPALTLEPRSSNDFGFPDLMTGRKESSNQWVEACTGLTSKSGRELAGDISSVLVDESANEELKDRFVRFVHSQVGFGEVFAMLDTYAKS